jgi:hypothetical protein
MLGGPANCDSQSDELRRQLMGHSELQANEQYGLTT